MTDKDIIKALECCSKDDCDNCPNTFGNCYSNLAGYALDLINRQKAEIERLQSMNQSKLDLIHDLRSDIEGLKFKVNGLEETQELIMAENDIVVRRAIKQAKTEAVREFVERLKEESILTDKFGEVVLVADINNCLKEMVGCADG